MPPAAPDGLHAAQAFALRGRSGPVVVRKHGGGESEMAGFSRLDLLKGCAVGLALSVALGCQSGGGGGRKTRASLPKWKSKDFYSADGKFDAAAAKKAYYTMMEYHGYPVSKLLRTDQFWVADFLQRDYEKLGMAGIFWMNAKGKYGEAGAKAYTGEFMDAQFGYLGHEIYLLPGQMLPEHRHIGGPEGYGPKMESWHVRHGSVTFFGQYKAADGDEKPISEMPASERPWGCGQDWFKSKYFAKRTPGELYSMNDAESWHFQRAGPDGAIVSEYATYHNDVRFSKPGMEFASSEAK